MRATIHALTGAAIAMAVKQPALAIPAAFLSHFVLDAVPHYNPPKRIRNNFKNYQESYEKAFKLKSFTLIFGLDMVLFAITLLTVPLLAPSGVSPLTVFFSALAGAAPDLDGGLRFLFRHFGLSRKKSKDNYWFSRFHLWFQWMERPWGIYVELVWLVLIIWAIAKLVG
jgi:hypothetical protein